MRNPRIFLEYFKLGFTTNNQTFRKTKGNNIDGLIWSITTKEKLPKKFGHIVQTIVMDLIKYRMIKIVPSRQD
jgi:uncharacterized membrane protein YagU involved in acid resistance